MSIAEHRKRLIDKAHREWCDEIDDAADTQRASIAAIEADMATTNRKAHARYVAKVDAINRGEFDPDPDPLDFAGPEMMRMEGA